MNLPVHSEDTADLPCFVSRFCTLGLGGFLHELFPLLRRIRESHPRPSPSPAEDHTNLDTGPLTHKGAGELAIGHATFVSKQAAPQRSEL